MKMQSAIDSVKTFQTFVKNRDRLNTRQSVADPRFRKGRGHQLQRSGYQVPIYYSAHFFRKLHKNEPLLDTPMKFDRKSNDLVVFHIRGLFRKGGSY